MVVQKRRVVKNGYGSTKERSAARKKRRAESSKSKATSSSRKASEPVLSQAEVTQLRGVAAREGAEAAAKAAEKLKAEKQKATVSLPATAKGRKIQVQFAAEDYKRMTQEERRAAVERTVKELEADKSFRAQQQVTQKTISTRAIATQRRLEPQPSAREALTPFTTTPFQEIQERPITYAQPIGREEVPTRYAQGVTAQPLTKFQKFEAKVARRVTKPVAAELAKRGVTKERVAKTVTAFTVKQYEKSPFLTQQEVEERRREQESFIKESAVLLQTKPLKTAAVYVGARTLGPAISGTQLFAAKVAPAAFLKAAPVVQKGLGFTGKALGVTYVGQTAVEYRAQPTPEARGAYLAGKVVTEIAPFVAGVRASSVTAARIQERAMVEATIAAKAPRETQLAFAEAKALAKQVKRADLPTQDPRIGEVLKPKAAKVTSQHFAKKGKARVIYGSAAQPSAVKPGDIDVAARNPYQAAVQYAEALQKAGIKDVVVPAAALRRAAVTGVEEATVFVQGKAVTFHTFKQLASNPFYKGGFKKSPSGVYVQQPQEQLLRKFTGAVYYGRAKDVPSYQELSGKLAQQVKAATPRKITPVKTTTPARAPYYYPTPKAPTVYPYPKPPKTPAYAYPTAPTTPAYVIPTKTPVGGYRKPPTRTPTLYAPPSRPPTYAPPVRPPTTPPYVPPRTPPSYPPRIQPPSYPVITRPPTITPPGIPTFQLPRREFKAPRFTVPKRKLKQPKRYAPTLRAAVGGIKARKGKKFKLTGLEERPILF